MPISLLISLAVIGTMIAAAFNIGDRSDEHAPTPSVARSPSASVTAEGLPPSPSPRRSNLSPFTESTPESGPAADLSIKFINLPETVEAGEKFIVRWRIEGPAGARGEKTNLTVLYDASSESNGSESSNRSKSSQSFGTFTIPAQFDASFSFGSMPADVELTATAEVAGQAIEEKRTVKLTP